MLVSYLKVKQESTHVQRVPLTETKGRRQTSVVSVAVLPVPPENIFKPLPEDELETIAQCGSGPGGQHSDKVGDFYKNEACAYGLACFNDWKVATGE